MINILIYDDSVDDIDKLTNLLNNLSKKISVDFKIDICKSSKFLLTKIDQYDFLFLDIEIGEENGIELGKNLNKIIHNCRIIITSNYKKYLIQGYKIHADRYFLKPITQLEFNVEMEEEIDQFKKMYTGFFDEKISNKKILFTEILYIDVYDRKTRIHFTNSKILSTGKNLKEWIDLLDMNMFEQSHKSFIVNLFHVTEINKHDLYLKNGEIIPLSRNFKKKFEQKYIEILPRMF